MTKKFVILNDRQVCDLEMILTGAFAPLTGFMNEEDYKNLISTYQRKSMDLFTQLVVAETKVEMLDAQLREARLRIQQLENETRNSQGDSEYA